MANEYPTSISLPAFSFLRSAPAPNQTVNVESTIGFDDAIRALYAPLLQLITEPNFTDTRDGTVYNFTGAPLWTESLGKRILILDVDTRPLDDANQIFNPTFSWASMTGVSQGMLNHYLYATIHGYSYKFIHTRRYPNASRADMWTKVSALADTLPHYDAVVMIDADAVFRHLHLPYEWLLNRWRVTRNTSLAMALDVSLTTAGEPIGYTNNRFGALNPNAGFITALNLPRTFAMLRAWLACPDDGERFPGCERFLKEWPAEQGAFGEYVRYMYDRETDFKAFACDDANGFPGQGNDCQGMLVRHFTTGKERLKEEVGDTVLQTIMGRVQADLMARRAEVWAERGDNAIHTAVGLEEDGERAWVDVLKEEQNERWIRVARLRKVPISGHGVVHPPVWKG
ncbi:hypothetical protein EJ06DRAFT_473241 [Trichodelitschia bisporula]|uniref:Nucleotide-diphospho-sugar transferase domain-containing protein n=1 Tax=Trichodelitschia bisporula TaxID=703511 RepID=A0A6G1I4E4_9PEZI|nr:hypothetical protein EJ06DRAFT_473241 [Trichodelitschia bisporula]